jgi:DNA-directed RNA polymerase specialized sigma24 family protein
VAVSGGSDSLSAEAFEKLLALLHPDRERAGEIYVTLRAKLIRLFEWRGSEQPETLADVTLNRVAANLAKGLVLEKPDPYSYFCGVAHNVHKEYLRDHFKKVEAVESGEIERRYLPLQEKEEEDPRLDGLRRCLDRLPGEERQLLLDYYPDGDRIRVRQQLAQRFGTSVNALRIKVHRIRQQVEKCLARHLGL